VTGNRSGFIPVPETLESHDRLSTAGPLCRSGIYRDRTVPRAPCRPPRASCRVPRCVLRIGETIATASPAHERAAPLVPATLF